MTESWCRSCLRPLPSPDAVCRACEKPRTVARAVLLIGAVGLPMLIIGMTSLNSRLSLAGAIISGVAAVVYTVLSIR